MKKIIAVIGDASIEEGGLKEKIAYETGKLLVENGYRVQSGGLKGVMNAAFRGARDAAAYSDGDTIAIVPSFDRTAASAHADIVVATGLDIFRNIIVANADAVIAVGGGAGTLSEMASAWALKRLIVAYDVVEGWSSKLAGQKIDGRNRYPSIADDRVYAASSPEEAIALINEKLPLYTAAYKGIKD